MPELKERNIFSIETLWYEEEEQDQSDRLSVRTLMETIDELCGTRNVNRDAATRGDLFHYIKKFSQYQATSYPILYLGFHGTEQGQIWLHTEDGTNDMVNSDVLVEHLRGTCKNRLVHFGACSSLKDMDHRYFLKETKATAVSGFSKVVEWTYSAAFELIYLEALQYHHGKTLTKSVAERVKTQMYDNPLSELRRHLGFYIHITR